MSNGCHLLRHQLAHSNVVQKEERRSTVGEDIINAMINEVNANGIVFIQSTGNFQLGAHTVNTGYQNRLLVPLEFKKPAKESNATQDLGTAGRLSLLFNQFFSSGRNININTRGGVGVLNLPYPRARISYFRLPETELKLKHK